MKKKRNTKLGGGTAKKTCKSFSGEMKKKELQRFWRRDNEEKMQKI